ncbi:class I SAM-dependent methyltransferase [Chloroflexi bacterium TSY]|nr:class I SAM-dependent methyltransferase [Chloroflexi bacterium TSY]
MSALSQSNSSYDKDIPVIDYEGSQYRTDFWVGQGRGYEDAVERLALNRLLPSHGGRMAEIGAGFGRLGELYHGYEQVILFDYSRSLLAEAVNTWGDDSRFVFVAGNIYKLPLATNILDALVMVRVMHHLADVGHAITQIKRTLRQDGIAVMEYANKRNLKSILRWVFGKQDWSPFNQEPLEFVALNFDFHPVWMDKQFEEAGLIKNNQFAVSHFRTPFLKNRFRAQTLARFDSWLFQLGGLYPITPSVFTQLKASRNRPKSVKTTSGKTQRREQTGAKQMTVTQLFRCPRCLIEAFEPRTEDTIVCGKCGAAFAKQSSIWNFKEIIN